MSKLLPIRKTRALRAASLAAAMSLAVLSQPTAAAPASGSETVQGLYDTLLKKDLELWALAVGAASFAWFALQVEMARSTDPEEEDARGTAWS